MICHKAEVSRQLRSRRYAMALLGVGLPMDLILYIAALAASGSGVDPRLLSVHLLAWRHANQRRMDVYRSIK